jgi:hypothetical protein
VHCARAPTQVCQPFLFACCRQRHATFYTLYFLLNGNVHPHGLIASFTACSHEGTAPLQTDCRWRVMSEAMVAEIAPADRPSRASPPHTRLFFRWPLLRQCCQTWQMQANQSAVVRFNSEKRATLKTESLSRHPYRGKGLDAVLNEADLPVVKTQILLINKLKNAPGIRL